MGLKEIGLSVALGVAVDRAFHSTIKRAGKSVKEFGQDIADLQGQDDFKMGKGLEELSAKARASNRELKASKKRLEDLKRQVMETQVRCDVFGGSVSKNLILKMQRAEQQVKSLSRATGKHRGKLRAQVLTIEEAGRSVSGLRKEYAGLEDQIDKLNKKSARKQKWMGVGRKVADAQNTVAGHALGAAAGGSLFLPVRAAIDFESAMAGVKKVVDFDSPEGFEEMGKSILDLSSRIPMAATGIASIVEAAGQSGIAQKDLLNFAETAAKMGVAFDLTGEQSGKMMADWRAGMKLSQAQALRLGDAVNHLSNKMNAKAGDLGELMQRMGATGMAAGLTEIQTASLGAALLSSGKGPDVASTALKNLTSSLTMGAAATKSQKEAFNALGLDAEEMAVKMQKDAPAAIQEVFDALSKAPKESQNALATMLFGKESIGAIMPLLSNLENLRGAFRLTANESEYAGSMDKEYQEQLKTTANQMELFKNSTTELGVVLGTSLLPAFNELLDMAKPAAKMLAEFAANHSVVVQVGASLLGGLVAVKAVSTLMSPFSALFSGRRKSGGGGPGGAVPVEVVNGGGFGGGFDGGSKGRGKSKGKTGRFGRLGKAVESGRGLFGKMGGGLLGKLGTLGKMGGGMLGKVFRPLGLITGAAGLVSGLASGSMADAGSAAGSLGGSAIGTALGATLGSIIPGFGTVLGGMAGGALGGWIGEKAGGWFGGSLDKEPEAATAAEVQPDGKTVNVNLTQDIKIDGNADPAAVKKAVNHANEGLEAKIRRIVEDILHGERRLSHA